MNPDQVFAFRKRNNNPGFLVSYLGNLSNEALQSVLALAEQKLINETETIKQKVSLFITECLADTGKKASGENTGQKFFFLLEKRDERYFAACGGLFEKLSASEIEKERNKASTSDESAIPSPEESTEEEIRLERSFLNNLIKLSAKGHQEVAHSVIQTAEGNTFFSFKTFVN